MWRPQQKFTLKEPAHQIGIDIATTYSFNVEAARSPEQVLGPDMQLEVPQVRVPHFPLAVTGDPA